MKTVILHHTNVFIIEDNILCHLGGPSDHTGSHGNWLNGCKIIHETENQIILKSYFRAIVHCNSIRLKPLAASWVY